MVLALALGNLRTQAWQAFLANPIVFEFAFGMGVAWAIRRGARLSHGIAAIVAMIAFAVLIATVNVETRLWSAGGSAVAMVLAMASFPVLRSWVGRGIRYWSG